MEQLVVEFCPIWFEQIFRLLVVCTSLFMLELPRLIGLFPLPLLAKAQPLETGLCRKIQRSEYRWMLLNDHIEKSTGHDKSGFIICQKFRSIFGWLLEEKILFVSGEKFNELLDQEYYICDKILDPFECFNIIKFLGMAQ